MERNGSKDIWRNWMTCVNFYEFVWLTQLYTYVLVLEKVWLRNTLPTIDLDICPNFRRFLGVKSPLELANVKNNNKKKWNRKFFDSICLLLWCQMTDLQCCLVYNSIFLHDVKYFQKFLGAKAPLGLVRVGKWVSE